MRKILIVISILSASVSPTLSQTQQQIDDVAKLLGRAQTKSSTLSFLSGQHERAGQWELALKDYTQLAAVYAENPSEGTHVPTYAWALAKQGWCQAKLRNTMASKDLCTKALQIIGSDFPDSNLSYSNQIRHTFEICRELGVRPTEDSISAEQLAEREKKLLAALKSQERRPALAKAQDICSLAYVYGRQRKFEQSQQLYAAALQYVSKAAAPLNSVLHATILSNQSDMLAAMGQQKSAFVTGVMGAVEMQNTFAPLAPQK